MSARRDAAMVVAALAVAVALEAGAALPFPEAIGDGATGAALLGAGALAATRRRGRATGALLLATGALWFAGSSFANLVFVHRAPLVLLLLAYPLLWPASRAAALVALAGIATALITPAARSAALTIALAVAIVLVAAVRHGRSAGIERRVAAAALGATGAVGVALALAGIGRVSGGALDELSLWCYEAAIALAAVGLGADLRWGRWERAAVSELVADLGVLDRPDALRARLARALGDPGLELGFAAGDGYADASDRAIDLARGGRAVSYVEEGDRRVAVLVHDPSLLEDRRLLNAASAAARLMAANMRMAAEVRAGVEQLEASRRRLVEAAIDQRRALEQELRDGAERWLEFVTERLGAIDGGETITELIASVGRAREDLRRFAQGIHPATLTDHGLRAALEEAAGLMPFEVTVAAPDERFPASVEVTVYFLCTEALSNAGKYAGASRVDIEVHGAADAVDAVVADDGNGGADIDAGSGLRGIADRVAALGGSLDVISPLGAGTRLSARIPI